MLTGNQLREELQRSTAHSHFNEQAYGAMTDFDRTKRFHQVMGLQCNDSPIVPTVSERILRAKLLLEETIETIEKGLGITLTVAIDKLGIAVNGECDLMDSIGFRHVEGDFYDPIETLDGLADVKVIAEGTAVAFGLPLEEASFEVYCSNMTKLDGNGNPIVNQCKLSSDECGMDKCCYDSHLIDPTKPRGKLLKSEFYVPANIARVILDSAPPEDRNRVLGVLEMNRK